jgi:hypothetical protein
MRATADSSLSLRMTRKNNSKNEHCPPFCAADIFVVNRGPSARTCLSYAARQISIEGESEFSRRPIHNRNISDNKPEKQKAARRVRLFWLLFWRSKKVTSRRATPGTLIQCSAHAAEENITSTPIPTFPRQGGRS